MYDCPSGASPTQCLDSVIEDNSILPSRVLGSQYLPDHTPCPGETTTTVSACECGAECYDSGCAGSEYYACSQYHRVNLTSFEAFLEPYTYTIDDMILPCSLFEQYCQSEGQTVTVDDSVCQGRRQVRQVGAGQRAQMAVVTSTDKFEPELLFTQFAESYQRASFNFKFEAATEQSDTSETTFSGTDALALSGGAAAGLGLSVFSVFMVRRFSRSPLGYSMLRT